MLNFYLISSLRILFGKHISTITISNHSLLIVLNRSSLDSLPLILLLLRSSSPFRLNTLTELTICDNPARKNRFTLNSFLLSVEYNFRIAINICFSLTNFVPSLSQAYINSNWSEREIRDMFGIYFVNNSDLRRLLTDYGFEGFPLRKDFPLTGYFEVRYDDERQQILYEPVQLTQEFRVFNLSSP